MANVKISQLTPKGANLAATDLLEISEFNGSGYETKSITGQEIIDAASGGGAAWGSITGTLSSQTDLNTALSGKQATLVSGTNIKTLEGQSLLGSGNIDLTKSDVGLANVDNTSDANKPISTATQTALNAKQAALVSGTNIKTINGSSVLGSGDLVINAGNRLATHILSKPRSGFNYSISLTQGNLTTGSQTANTLVLTAFTPAYNFEIDRFILNVSTLAAGGLAKVVVYSDLDGVPNSKLYESATVTTDTTGLKTMSGFTYLFSAGVTYWIGVVTNTSVAQFTVLNSASLMLAPVIASTTSTQIFTCWSIPVTFASLPATLTTPTTGNLSHLSVPYIMFRAF